MESERLLELVAAARNGDTTAFAELTRGHRARLGSLVERIVGDRSEAEDVVQEALLRAYLGLTQLRDPERFGAWLYGIAINVARMVLRRRAAYERVLARVASAPPIPTENPIGEGDVLGLVRDAVQLLPRAQREVVLLHYVDELSCEEIAAVLGRSPGAVRVRLHRARARLRAELAPFALADQRIGRKEEAMIEVRLEDVLVRVGEDDPEKVVADQRIVLLGDPGGGRVLPIWIGAAEGNSLAFRLRGESSFRPMTSDVLAEVVRLTGSRVDRMAITRLHENTFYAVITLTVDGRTEELDARPSDALNLAARTAAPVLVHEDVLDEAAIGREELATKLEGSESAHLELPEGEWRSLSASLLQTLHAPPRGPLGP